MYAYSLTDEQTHCQVAVEKKFVEIKINETSCCESEFALKNLPRNNNPDSVYGACGNAFLNRLSDSNFVLLLMSAHVLFYV